MARRRTHNIEFNRHVAQDYLAGETLRRRYVRWAAKGVWVDLFHSLASAGGPLAQALINSSIAKAHRLASSGTRGSGAEPSVVRAAVVPPNASAERPGRRPIAFLQSVSRWPIALPDSVRSAISALAEAKLLPRR